MSFKAPSKYESWSAEEIRLFRRLNTPCRIQGFLDQLCYSHSSFTRSPREVIKTGYAHCFDGSLFAAAALEQHGFPPLIVDLFAENDDDHVIAVFRIHGLWGAIGKSNFSGLRYREPVYRSLRELIMSYYESYFNLRRERTLRSYSQPFNLRRIDKTCWRTTKEHVDFIAEYLNSLKHFEVLPRCLIKGLSRVDQRLFLAGKLGRQ